MVPFLLINVDIRGLTSQTEPRVSVTKQYSYQEYQDKAKLVQMI